MGERAATRGSRSTSTAPVKGPRAQRAIGGRGPGHASGRSSPRAAHLGHHVGCVAAPALGQDGGPAQSRATESVASSRRVPRNSRTGAATGPPDPRRTTGGARWSPGCASPGGAHSAPPRAPPKGQAGVRADVRAPTVSQWVGSPATAASPRWSGNGAGPGCEGATWQWQPSETSSSVSSLSTLAQHPAAPMASSVARSLAGGRRQQQSAVATPPEEHPRGVPKEAMAGLTVRSATRPMASSGRRRPPALRPALRPARGVTFTGPGFLPIPRDAGRGWLRD